MAHRVTQEQLEAQIDALNATLGHEANQCLVLDWAYGGVRLDRFTPSGGRRHVSPSRGTKREMESFLLAFSMGIEEARGNV